MSEPFSIPGAWAETTFGGRKVPGIIQDIDGLEKPLIWDFVRGLDGRMVSIYRGRKLAEEIKIMIHLQNADDLADYESLVAFMGYYKQARPPALDAINGLFQFCRVNRIAIKSPGQPKYDKKSGSWDVVLTVVEYNPQLFTTPGPASPALTDQGTPSAPDAVDLQINALIQKAKEGDDAPLGSVAAL